MSLILGGYGIKIYFCIDRSGIKNPQPKEIQGDALLGCQSPKQENIDCVKKLDSSLTNISKSQ